MGLLQSNHSKMPLVTRPCVWEREREREREREIRSTHFSDLFWDPIVTITNS